MAFFLERWDSSVEFGDKTIGRCNQQQCGYSACFPIMHISRIGDTSRNGPMIKNNSCIMQDRIIREELTGNHSSTDDGTIRNFATLVLCQGM